MQKEITINGKTIVVKEVKYKDMVANSGGVDKDNSVKFLLKASTGITDEEYDNLSMKEGIQLQKLVNDVNGLSEGFL